jgi:hypothetical protein
MADSGTSDDEAEEMSQSAPTVVYINSPSPSTPVMPPPAKTSKRRSEAGGAHSARNVASAHREDCDEGGQRSLWEEIKAAHKPYCKDLPPPTFADPAKTPSPPRQVRYTLAN